jgi:hypothetical protein
MKINAFFEKRLQAPLYNHVWSWGAINRKSGTIFLRVGSGWLDTYDDGKEWAVLLHPKWREKPNGGLNERLQHLDLMRDGTPAYAVVVEFNEYGKISSFDESFVLKLGRPVNEGTQVYAQVLSKIPVEEISDKKSRRHSIEEIMKITFASDKETERDTLVSARLGQGAFRESVLSRWDYRCAVTGCDIHEAIRASHIKPWRFCTNTERLDPNNGLPLLATYDALFDRGLISFDSRGHIILSGCISNKAYRDMGLTPSNKIRIVGKYVAEYLKFHREHVFIGDRSK